MKKDTTIGLCILFGVSIIFSFFVGFQWTVRILLIMVDIVSIGLVVGIIRSLKMGILNKLSKYLLSIGLALSLICSFLGHLFIKIPFANVQLLIILSVMALVFTLTKLK